VGRRKYSSIRRFCAFGNNCRSLIAAAPNESKAVSRQVTPRAKQVRLRLLLNRLRKERWRKLPKQVGLKTALVAVELGLIETKGDDLSARGWLP
jgi:hypothetical protein